MGFLKHVRRQRRASSAPRIGLQPWQFHADIRDAEHGGAVVADQPAREADQDRCQGRQPRPLCHLPDGRGRSVAADVPGNPVADRPAAGTARASMKGDGQTRQATTGQVRLEASKQRLSTPRRGLLAASTASRALHARFTVAEDAGGAILSSKHRESEECRLISVLQGIVGGAPQTVPWGDEPGRRWQIESEC